MRPAGNLAGTDGRAEPTKTSRLTGVSKLMSLQKEANMDTTHFSNRSQSGGALSRDFDAGRYDFSVSPEDFFDSKISLSTVCPETTLMYAVVEDAFQCFQRRFENENPGIQRAARQAEEWFFKNDSHEFFSFVAICTALGLEAEVIRKRLMYLRRAREGSVRAPANPVK